MQLSPCYQLRPLKQARYLTPRRGWRLAMKGLQYLGCHLQLPFKLLLKVHYVYHQRSIKQEVELLLIITLLIKMLLLPAMLRNVKSKVSTYRHSNIIFQMSCKTLRAIKAAKSASSTLRKSNNPWRPLSKSQVYLLSSLLRLVLWPRHWVLPLWNTWKIWGNPLFNKNWGRESLRFTWLLLIPPRKRANRCLKLVSLPWRSLRNSKRRSSSHLL